MKGQQVERNREGTWWGTVAWEGNDSPFYPSSFLTSPYHPFLILAFLVNMMEWRRRGRERQGRIRKGLEGRCVWGVSFPLSLFHLTILPSLRLSSLSLYHSSTLLRPLSCVERRGDGETGGRGREGTVGGQAVYFLFIFYLLSTPFLFPLSLLYLLCWVFVIPLSPMNEVKGKARDERPNKWRENERMNGENGWRELPSSLFSSFHLFSCLVFHYPHFIFVGL